MDSVEHQTTSTWLRLFVYTYRQPRDVMAWYQFLKESWPSLPKFTEKQLGDQTGKVGFDQSLAVF